METATLVAPDISCEHCQRAIEQALGAEPGVDRVQVDITAKSVTVRFDPASTSLPVLSSRLEEEGYPVAV